MQSAVDHAVLLSMQRAVVLLRSSVLPQCATATSASSTLDRLLSCSSSTLGAGAPSTSTSPSWSTAASLQHLWHGRQHSTTAAGAAAAAASPSTSANAPSLPLAEASSSWQASSYEQVMREHGAMEALLRRSSLLDGTQRLQLSTNQLRFPVPQHDIEPDLMTMDVYLRPDYGSNFCKWLRKAKRVPGRVTFNPGRVPGNDPKQPHTMLLVHFAKGDVDRLVRENGRIGCQARIVKLRVLDPEDPSKELAAIRAKPQRVLCNAASLEAENLELLHCEQRDIVRVNVPIRPVNLDASAGVRKGGWIMMLKRTVPYQCLGTHIPPFVEVDVKGLDVDGLVRVRDLPIPEGTRLIKQDFNALVLKCTTEGGDEVRVR